MTAKFNPAARDAGRAEGRFNSLPALNDLQLAQSLAARQAAYVGRNFKLSPNVAATVARLAFSTREAR